MGTVPREISRSREEAAVQKVDESAPGADDPAELAALAFQAGIRREESFELIVKSYYDPVKGFFNKRVFSDEDCMELTQEVFLRVYKGLSGFRGEALFRTWLFQIVHNTYLKWLRGRRRVVDLSRDTTSAQNGNQTSAMDEHQPVAAVAAAQLDELLQKERLQLLRAAIEELSPQMQECIKLRVYYDCSYKEIADFMKLSIETVKVHLHRARRTLKKKLAGHFQEIEL